MNKLYEEIKRYLKENPFDGGQREAGSAIDFVVECYMEENPVSGEEIKNIEREMAQFYEELPFAGSEKLFLLVYALCGEYERAAFREGLMVGLHFREEMDSACLHGK